MPFHFTDPPRTRVFVCGHVAAGAPILYVSHDPDGDWQFLCGAEHGEAEKPQLVCLEDVVARDASLNELAGMCTNHEASRTESSRPWRIVDLAEDFIQRSVRDHGWAVQLIPAGDADDEPAFAYTVGVFKSFGQPELIVFGQSPELMHAMLNEVGERARKGQSLRQGDVLSDVIEGHVVRLREVSDPRSFRNHVGYALWFYERSRFPLLQVVWPDQSGRFPGDDQAAPEMKQRQPMLP